MPENETEQTAAPEETAALTAETTETETAETEASATDETAPTETAATETETAPETAETTTDAPAETDSVETDSVEAAPVEPAEPEEEEDVTYHAVQKDNDVTAIWEMQGRKHLRTIDPRSREGAEILRLFTAEEGEEIAEAA